MRDVCQLNFLLVFFLIRPWDSHQPLFPASYADNKDENLRGQNVTLTVSPSKFRTNWEGRSRSQISRDLKSLHYWWSQLENVTLDMWAKGLVDISHLDWGFKPLVPSGPDIPRRPPLGRPDCRAEREDQHRALCRQAGSQEGEHHHLMLSEVGGEGRGSESASLTYLSASSWKLKSGEWMFLSNSKENWSVLWTATCRKRVIYAETQPRSQCISLW